jgi:DNA-binding transcriptional regulator YbjK
MKMKRSEINLTDKERIKHLRAVMYQRQGQLAELVRDGERSRRDANGEQLSILEMIELIQAWQKKGLSYSEILDIVNDLQPAQGRREVKQNKIQFPI